MKINFFKGFQNSLQDIKKRYKDLAMKNHPDKGGDLETMKSINLEYEFIIKNKLFNFKDENEKKSYSQSDSLKYPDIINELFKLKNINIELCGSWLWISGCTYPIKDTLKKIGCSFAPKKLMWYYRPPEQKRKPGISIPMELIRKKYGSTFLENSNENPTKLI